MPAEAAPSFLWVPELGTEAAAVELTVVESHYLIRVCRARLGDTALATDGRGTLAELRVVGLGKRVRAEILRLDRVERGRRAWVLCGAPEGQRGDWLVEKLAELGVAIWQPIDCRRGRWRCTSAVVERWRRLAVAALRQSRRRFLMEVREPMAIAAAVGSLPAAGARWVADPTGRAGVEAQTGDAETIGLVGPSGGLEPSEQDLLSGEGFEPMSLSDGRLRTETAALAWAAWWARGKG